MASRLFAVAMLLVGVSGVRNLDDDGLVDFNGLAGHVADKGMEVELVGTNHSHDSKSKLIGHEEIPSGATACIVGKGCYYLYDKDISSSKSHCSCHFCNKKSQCDMSPLSC